MKATNVPIPNVSTPNNTLNKEKAVENIVRKEKLTDYITTLNNLREHKFLDGFTWLKTQTLFVVFIDEINKRYILSDKPNETEPHHWQEFSENFTLLNKNNEKITLTAKQLTSIHSRNFSKENIGDREALLRLFK